MRAVPSRSVRRITQPGLGTETRIGLGRGRHRCPDSCLMCVDRGFAAWSRVPFFKEIEDE